MWEILIFAGVALIDLKLWAAVIEQRRHNKEVESLLGANRNVM